MTSESVSKSDVCPFWVKGFKEPVHGLLGSLSLVSDSGSIDLVGASISLDSCREPHSTCDEYMRMSEKYTFFFLKPLKISGLLVTVAYPSLH